MMMADDPFYTPNLRRAPLSVGQLGELLFEFSRPSDQSQVRVELRDHGELYGIDCQIFQDGELLSARRFDPRLDASRTSRELAIQWAQTERKDLDRERRGVMARGTHMGEKRHRSSTRIFGRRDQCRRRGTSLEGGSL